MRHFPHTGRRRPDKAYVSSLSHGSQPSSDSQSSLYRSIASALTQDRGAGTKEIPQMHCGDATYILMPILV
jgi:hypothetical protein